MMLACGDNNLILIAVQTYFSQLNPLAEKVIHDINETKSSYGQVWYTLSQNEQNDIINETLIKPEISLLYHGNLSISSSASEYLSKQSSDESFTVTVFKDMNKSIIRKTTKDDNQIKKKLSTPSCKLNKKKIMNYTAYDGCNLSTFALQKVALKILSDDIGGCYRDEHSSPFFYRTKSQLNIKIFENNYKTLQTDTLLLIANEKRNNLLHGREKNILQNSNAKIEKSQANINSNVYEIFSKNNKSKYTISTVKNVGECRSFNKNHKKGSYLKTLTESSNARETYAIYANTYIVHEERFKLLNYSNNDILTISSSSSVTSDEDDNGEKTVCEDVKLLDNDNLKRGFDFLNNW